MIIRVIIIAAQTMIIIFVVRNIIVTSKYYSIPSGIHRKTKIKK